MIRFSKTYTISNQITPASNQVWDGLSTGVIKFADGYSGTNWLVKIDGVSNVEIRGLVLDGNKNNIINNVGTLYINNSTNIKVHDNYIQNSKQDHVYIGHSTTPSSNILIHHNYVSECTRTPFVITSGSEIEISDNIGSAGQNNNSLVDIETNQATETVQNVIVSRNILWDSSNTTLNVAIGVSGPGTQKNITFSDNIFMTNGRFGDINGENVKIINNHASVQNVSTKYLLNVGTADKLVLSNNTITEYGGTGTGGGVEVEDPTDAIVSFNIIENVNGSGILIDLSDNASGNGIVEGNRIINAAGAGLVCLVEGFDVKNNNIETPSGDGIYVGRSKVTVTGNRIVSPGSGIGIDMGTAGHSGLIVKDNILSAGYIKLLNQDNTTISGNYIDGEGTTAYGIWVDNIGSSNINIEGNQIKNCNGPAIDVEGSDITVVNNQAWDDQAVKTQTHGLKIQASTDYLIIHGNNFRNNALGGISGSVTNYRPNQNGSFAADMATFNF